MDEANLHKVLKADFVMVGSDGNAVAPYGKLATGKPHPRYYGTFPRVLGRYVREAGTLELADAIRKMTSMPADVLGLRERGRLKPGHMADVVVFNPAEVNDQATFADPHQFPVGIQTVIVNGALAIAEGTHTGKLNGRVLRHQA
jgi:N-acyl-D-amino-acid deacylase